MKRFLFALLLVFLPGSALAQGVCLQGGPWAPGDVPVYAANSGSQCVIVDYGSPPPGAGSLSSSKVITYSGGVSAANNVLYVNTSASGTCTGSPSNTNGPDCSLNTIDITSNTVNGAGSVAPGFEVNHQFGGSGFQGAAVGIEAILDQTATTSNNSNGEYVGLLSVVQGNANDNGTSGSYNGAVYGLNANVRLSNNATYWLQDIGAEIDVAALTGTSVKDIIGEQIVIPSNAAVQGSRDNVGLSFNNQPTTTIGWAYGIAFGIQDGYWPMLSSGTLIGAEGHLGGSPAGTAAHGVDFSNVTLTSDAFKSNGFKVDGSGNVYGASFDCQISGCNIPFNQSSQGTAFNITGPASATIANLVTVTGVATGSSPIVSGGGSDTNVSLTLSGKGTGGVIISGPLTPAQKTVSTLPTCNSGSKGQMFVVTDADSPTWDGTLSGSGSTVVGALCNGSNWVAM